MTEGMPLIFGHVEVAPRRNVLIEAESRDYPVTTLMFFRHHKGHFEVTMGQESNDVSFLVHPEVMAEFAARLNDLINSRND